LSRTSLANSGVKGGMTGVKGGIVDVEDFGAGERIGQGFDTIVLDRLDFRKLPQESFVHHIRINSRKA
jgi:hypothetical protein